jgi:hypothetical protein
LRIDSVTPSDEVDEAEDDDAEINPLSFKNDDIANMPAYRDAFHTCGRRACPTRD